MKCSKQTTDKLGKSKEGKMLAVETVSMQFYCCFFSQSVFTNIVVLNCSNSSAAFPNKRVN